MRVLRYSAYADAYQDSLTYSDSELEEAYGADRNTYDHVSYEVVSFSGAAESTTDDEGNTVEPTEEERTAALQAAKAQADRFAALVEEAADKEAEFIKLAPDYVTESRKANYEEDPDYSLAEGINGGTLSSNAMYYGLTYATWLMEDGRKAGDVTVVESSSGYYVVLFLDRYLEEGNTANIRHILVKAELTQEDDASTEDVDESRIPSQEALDAAKTEIDSLLAQWEGGAKTAESFGALALEHSDDSGSASNGGLISAITPYSNYVDTFTDWALDPARKVGDTELVQNTGSSVQGWHVMYLAAQGDPYWMMEAQSVLSKEAQESWLTERTDSVSAVDGSGLKYV